MDADNSASVGLGVTTVASRTYADLDLRFEGAGDGVSIRVTSSPVGEAGPVPLMLPGPLEDLERLLSALAPWRARTRGPVRTTERREGTRAVVRDIGTALFDAVFHGAVRDAFVGSRHRCPDGLRIRFDLTEAPTVARLPWEMVYDKGSDRFLALSERTPVVRYLQLTRAPDPLAVEGPLRILAVLSSPQGLEPLDLDGEWEGMRSALSPLIDAGSVTLDRLTPPTLDGLHRYLRQHEVHVLHVVGHADLDVASGVGVFFVEGSDHRARGVSAHDVGPDLHDHDPLRLVVLNACQTASPALADAYSGLAQGLVRQWVPAVVAMQVPITDRAAIAFSRDFYSAVASGQPVDQAVTGARKAVHVDFPEEWATPVLFMRAASGDLFTPRAAGTRSRTGATPELVIREDGRFVGGDREAATAAVLTVLEQPVGERSVAVHALPLDDADFRTSFPDAYARLRRGVDALGTALRLLVRGRATYSVTWTVEQLVDAVLELRAICLPAQGDREDWYAWPVDRPTEVHTVRLDPRWVRWFATGAFRWTPDNEPVDGAPPDAPLWLRYVDPALVWGRLVPALLAELAVDGLALDQSNGDHVVLDEWVISNRRPTELASQRPVEPRE